VRVAPDELAFADSAAWKDIMGHRSNGDEMAKWSKFYRPVEGMDATDLVYSSREEHGLLRRQIAHGFSDRAMRDQQPLIGKYIDLLVSKLTEKCATGSTAVNLADWYNFTTFDVIGDLAFGESFGCLDNSDYHPWVKAIFELGRVGTFFQASCHYPLFQRLILSLIPNSAKEKRQQHLDFTKAKLLKRMELGQDRPDLIEGLLKKKDEWNLDLDKLEANASLLIIGGSETTATLLSGVTYLLLMNQSALDRLTEEVRSAFSSEEEIDLISVGKLTYMLACLDEALRMYPPVPMGLPRVVPRGGGMIAGNFVPEKVRRGYQ
jgi:cytochrome P450